MFKLKDYWSNILQGLIRIFEHEFVQSNKRISDNSPIPCRPGDGGMLIACCVSTAQDPAHI